MRSKHDFPSVNAKLPEGIKPNGQPYKCIVTDDQDFQRKQIVQILESEGYKVLGEASNGQQAIEIYDKNAKDVDFITTDLDMPEVDGYALLFEINNRKSQAKVIFISEETTKGVLQDLLKMGAKDFILKPIKRSVLLDRVKSALKK